MLARLCLPPARLGWRNAFALGCGAVLGLTVPSWGASRAEQRVFTEEIRPRLEQYCFECHGERRKGDLDLRPYEQVDRLRSDRSTFERVYNALRSQEMPPRTKPQPSAEERRRLLEWLEATLFPVDCRHPDPGRVTLRRLNRDEYNRTVRDLVGIDFAPAADFPADDAGYGFDNIGDVLSLSPTLFEKYLEAAEKILDRAIVTAPVPGQPLPATHRRIFGEAPGGTSAAAARGIVERFARRAFRRPVKAEEVDRLMDLFESAQARGDRFEQSVQAALSAVLVSPHFLFRGELQPEPDNPQAVHRVDEHALASRLSYFLWSSLPDEELFRLAERGKLRRNLEAQVRRMLRDPKSDAFVQNFAGQWLQLRNLELIAPDAKVFPEFDAPLRAAMRRETELFFEHLLRADRSVLDFLTADYTFVNERLARHYGLRGVQGDAFRRVSLAGTHRAGVLTQGSVLTLTSNPTRTSPVKRGKWVLENLLGTPPPPPPPNVPPLDNPDQTALAGSLRLRMEQHRNNPNCSSCHERMDPIGFGLEHFDGVGAWRDQEGTFPIEDSGQLVSGEHFAGVDDLCRVLQERKRAEFLRCLTSKLLIYALGRGLEAYDRCAVDGILQGLAKRDTRFSTLILEVTRSAPFQMRRGDSTPPAAAPRS